MDIIQTKNEIKKITNLYPDGKILDLCSGNGDFLGFIEEEIKNFAEIVAIKKQRRKKVKKPRTQRKRQGVIKERL